MKYFFCFFVLLFISALVCGQHFASWKVNRLILDNGVIKREVSIENNRVVTSSISLKKDSFNFVTNQSREFSFMIDSKHYDGFSGWELISFAPAKDNNEGKGASMRIKGVGDLSKIELQITYLLYVGMPVIRKEITVFNKSDKEIKLESFSVEKLKLGFSYVGAATYTNYGKQKHLGPYIGDWDDPILAVHSYDVSNGLIVGDEAPGVLKRIDYNLIDEELNAGLTHINDDYPFRKYIQPLHSWTAPKVFVLPYLNQYDPWEVMNTTLNDFQRKHLGLRIYSNRYKPTFMYNNYFPFRDNYNDTLLIDVARSAAESGIRQFVIDCGWHVNLHSMGKNVSWGDNCGDWIVDKKKFPGGLKPVFDSVRRMGMDPGLWISVGTASVWADIYQKHPEWVIRDKEGDAANIHNVAPKPSQGLVSMCLGTEWKNYSKQKILGLVKELGLTYVKLDLSVATSAYQNDITKSGCYATNHPGHKDREESFISIYTNLFELFDELHKEVPELYIDCTFEVAGKLQLIDYAFCQHAESNWLTNIEVPYPVGAYRVRDLGWWKTPVMPASSLIIGNLSMNNEYFIEELKTLIGTFPIVLGDPRKLSKERKSEIKDWGNWIVDMQQKYNYTEYRQNVPSFGEPVEGGWDAWSRINTDSKKGGIIGIYRQGSLDDTRTISVPGLHKNSLYIIALAPKNKEVAKMTGKDLAEKGFKVKMMRKYESKLFHIQMIK